MQIEDQLLRADAQARQQLLAEEKELMQIQSLKQGLEMQLRLQQELLRSQELHSIKKSALLSSITTVGGIDVPPGMPVSERNVPPRPPAQSTNVLSRGQDVPAEAPKQSPQKIQQVYWTDEVPKLRPEKQPSVSEGAYICSCVRMR